MKSQFSYLIPGHPNGVNSSRHTPFSSGSNRMRPKKSLPCPGLGLLLLTRLSNLLIHLSMCGSVLTEKTMMRTKSLLPLILAEILGHLKKRVLGRSVLLIMNTPPLKRPLVLTLTLLTLLGDFLQTTLNQKSLDSVLTSNGRSLLKPLLGGLSLVERGGLLELPFLLLPTRSSASLSLLGFA